MKRPRVRRRWLVPLSFLLLPPVFWGMVLAVTPTEWARSRVVARLSESTGRPIELGALKLGVLGGVYLADLRIGAPGATADPWLKVSSGRINVSLLQLLAGQVEPNEIRIDGLVLRVLRRRDGTLELADLVRPGRAEPADASAPECAGPAAVEVRLRNAQITVIDEPSGTRLEFTEVEGLAVKEGRRAVLHDLRGLLNGGRFELSASLDRSGEQPAWEGHVRAQGVELGQGTRSLAYLIPMLSGLPDGGAVEGRMDANVYVRGAGATRGALWRSLVGQGSIHLDPVELDRSRFLAELTRLIDLPDQAPAGSLKSDFTIKDGRVSSQDLTVVVGGIPIVLAGWTGFDGRLDYRVRSDSLADRLPEQASEFLSEMGIETKDLASLRLQGTLDDMDVTSDLRSGGLLGVGSSASRRSLDRRKVRDLGRRLRDRVLR